MQSRTSEFLFLFLITTPFLAKLLFIKLNYMDININTTSIFKYRSMLFGLEKTVIAGLKITGDQPVDFIPFRQKYTYIILITI